MKILIVDDEPPARSRLAAMLDDLDEVEVVGQAATGHEAIALVEALSPELILLDIRMPGMDGLEVARHLLALDRAPAVIFTTAYDAHALEAFEAQAIDYLLKPIRQGRLEQAIARVTALTAAQSAHRNEAQADTLRRERESQGTADAARTHLSAQIGGRLHLLAVEEVRYLRAENKYVVAGHPHGELLLSERLVGLEQEFAARFVRAHRKALVAPEHVRALTRGARGGYRVSLEGVEITIEVSRRMLSMVRARLTNG